MSLLFRSGALGHKMTAREEVKMQLHREKLGLGDVPLTFAEDYEAGDSKSKTKELVNTRVVIEESSESDESDSDCRSENEMTETFGQGSFGGWSFDAPLFETVPPAETSASNKNSSRKKRPLEKESDTTNQNTKRPKSTQDSEAMATSDSLQVKSKKQKKSEKTKDLLAKETDKQSDSNVKSPETVSNKKRVTWKDQTEDEDSSASASESEEDASNDDDSSSDEEGVVDLAEDPEGAAVFLRLVKEAQARGNIQDPEKLKTIMKLLGRQDTLESSDDDEGDESEDAPESDDGEDSESNSDDEDEDGADEDEDDEDDDEDGTDDDEDGTDDEEDGPAEDENVRVVPVAPSSFAFSISLPKSKRPAPKSDALVKAQESSEKLEEKPEQKEVPTATYAASDIIAGVVGKAKRDETVIRLDGLRQRNELERKLKAEGKTPAEIEANVKEFMEEYEGGMLLHSTSVSSFKDESGELRNHSVYRAADGWSSDEEEGSRRQRRRLQEAADEVREKAEAEALMPSPEKIPDSSLSAYAPTYVPVRRNHYIASARANLPVVGMEQEIVEMILNHDISILAGETGSGKTTQVPQFLYEAGFAMHPAAINRIPPAQIGAAPSDVAAQEQSKAVQALLEKENVDAENIQQATQKAGLPLYNPYRPNALFKGFPGIIAVTQPRRVATTAMAARVAQELGAPIGNVPDDSTEKDSEEANTDFGESAAASTTSKRKAGNLVGYQIRYDSSTVGRNTRVKFLTDGVLLRELQDDFLLRRYSVIILDEAHERNINTDVLLGLLSRVIPLRNKIAAEQAASLKRKVEADANYYLPAPGSPEAPLSPLKLVIMSATLRVTDFTENKRLFPIPPPVINVTARQYPVTSHFSKRTGLFDYVSTAFSRVVKIHERLPEGGILVFLTGQDEIEDLVRRLKKYFNTKRRKYRAQQRLEAAESNAAAGTASTNVSDASAVVAASTDASSWSFGGQADANGGTNSTASNATTKKPARNALETLLEEDRAESKDTMKKSSVNTQEEPVVHYISSDEEDIDMNLGTDNEDADSDTEQELVESLSEEVAKDGSAPQMSSKDKLGEYKPVHVLPLYALLPRAEQDKVFAPPPKNHRLIVVATNVAETSITIPNIRYVVDSGRVKKKKYDARSGVAKFEVDWISRAAADQRAGRAGRTAPGNCYRLYSAAVFGNTFQAFDDPEVVRTPVEDLVLNLKAQGIQSVADFPFPTPPPPVSLLAAIRSLTALGAIVPVLKSKTTGKGGLDTLLDLEKTVGEATQRAMEQKKNELIAKKKESEEEGSMSKDKEPELSAKDKAEIAIKSLEQASLVALGLIAKEEITPLGQLLARIPVAPPLAKMIVLAYQQQKTVHDLEESLRSQGRNKEADELQSHPCYNLLHYTCILVSAITVQNPLVMPSLLTPTSSTDTTQSKAKEDKPLDAELFEEEVDHDVVFSDDEEENKDALAELATNEDSKEAQEEKLREEKEKKKRTEARNAAYVAHGKMKHPLSDALTVLKASGAYRHALSTAKPDERHIVGREFCKKYWLRAKAMREVSQLSLQLYRIAVKSVDNVFNPKKRVPKKPVESLPVVRNVSGLPVESLVTQNEEENLDLLKSLEDSVDAAELNVSKRISNTTLPSKGEEDEWNEVEEDEEENVEEEEAKDSKKSNVSDSSNSTTALTTTRRNPTLQVLPPPSIATEALLRQLFVAGNLERTARRASADVASQLCAAYRMPPSQWTPYIPTSSAISAAASSAGTLNSAGTAEGAPAPGVVWIHPTSAISQSDLSLAPEWIAFGEMFYGKKGRTFVKNVTVTEATWLYSLSKGTPLCSLSGPVENPPPVYDPAQDLVVCHKTPIFGDKGWKLPLVRTPFSEEDNAVALSVRYFARAILEGKAIPALKPMVPALQGSPSLLTRNAVQRKVLILVEALMRPVTAMHVANTNIHAVHLEPVYSMAQLKKVWKYSPGFLATEITGWYSKDAASAILSSWPKIVQATIGAAPTASSSSKSDAQSVARKRGRKV